MEKWKAIPNVKIGEIEFGMDRATVRKLFNNHFLEFRKTPYSKNMTDDFGEFHVYYDDSDRCEAVEIFGGVEVEMGGQIVYPNSISVLEGLIKDLEDDGYGLISISNSIGITVSDESDQIEGILFGNKDYYI
jgi:hypothetical protein